MAVSTKEPGKKKKTTTTVNVASSLEFHCLFFIVQGAQWALFFFVTLSWTLFGAFVCPLNPGVKSIMDQQPYFINIPYSYLKDAITFNHTEIMTEMCSVLNDFERQCDSVLFLVPLNEQSETLDTSGPVHKATSNRARHRKINTGQ